MRKATITILRPISRAGIDFSAGNKLDVYVILFGVVGAYERYSDGTMEGDNLVCCVVELISVKAGTVIRFELHYDCDVVFNTPIV